MKLFPDVVVERAAAGDDLPDGRKALLRSGRSFGEGVDHRRHARENGDFVLFAESEVGVVVVPLHHNEEGAGPHRGDAPGEADMPHRVDAEIDVVLFVGQHIADVVDRGEPVSVGKHRSFGFACRSGRILQLAEVVVFGVCRQETGFAAQGFDVSGDIDPDLQIAGGGDAVWIGDEDLRARVFRHIGKFAWGIDAICGNRDAADPPYGEVGEEVFGAAVHIEEDTVAFHGTE